MFEIDEIVGPYRNDDGSEWVRVRLRVEGFDETSQGTIRTLIALPVRVLPDTKVVDLKQMAIARAKIELATLIT
jgi:hypothetical protein